MGQMGIYLVSTINNHVKDSMNAMHLYHLNDENYWLRWMVKVCSKDRNFASTVHIGSLTLPL